MAPNPTRLLCVFLHVALVAAPGLLLAQEPEGPDSNPDAEDPSRETDISEDNYRRFMELDDRRLERPAFPVASMAPATTLQKMGQLPESSQKHLRNQLRGIILRRGAWTPAERDASYAFVPSPEARNDPQLLRQEAEAWNELVNEYHDREAAILAGTAGQAAGGTGAASMEPGDPGQAAQGAPPGSRSARQANAGTAAGASGTGGQQGQTDEAGQEGRDGAQGEHGSEGGPDSKSGTASSTAAPPPERREAPEWTTEDAPDRPSTPPGNEGVEQSASDYLRARGLADSEPVQLQGAQGRTGPAGEERATRWGEEAQTLLDDRKTMEGPARRISTPPPVGEASDAGDPINSLTREQLREVRGVSGDDSPPEDAFVDFRLGGTAATAPGTREEEPSDGEDGGRGAPDADDDGRP